MSQQNLEAFKRGVSAFNRRDLAAWLELFDPDVEGVPLLVAVEGGYHGHRGMRRWWGNLLDVFPDFAIEVVEVRDLGDVTLGHLRYRAHAAESDAPVEAPLWMVVRWRRGKCTWWGTFGGEAEALEAVWLSA
jgi:ketosteroid isomerase-like protein